MMKRVLAGLLCVLASAAPASESLEVFAHSLQGAAELHDGQPKPLPGGGMRAFSLALTLRLLAGQQRPYIVREVPMTRGIQLLGLPQPVMLIGQFRTPEREALYRWIGPLFTDQTLLYRAGRRPVVAHTLAEASGLPVCAVRGGTHALRLRALGFADIELAPSYATCLRMLAVGRVKLAAVVRGDFPVRLREAGLPPGSIEPSGLVLLSADNYLVASLSLPAAEADALNRNLAALRASPEYEQLRQLYWP